jgi:hypothetical protein
MALQELASFTRLTPLSRDITQYLTLVNESRSSVDMDKQMELIKKTLTNISQDISRGMLLEEGILVNSPPQLVRTDRFVDVIINAPAHVSIHRTSNLVTLTYTTA